MKKTVKILSVVLMAVVLCVGLIACAHKNVSDHTATGDWLSDENDHWHACEKADCIDAGDRAAHEFDNACDADCNVCGYVRTPEAHVYENACDGDCGVCGGVRTPEAHVFDNDCDTTCNVCGLTRNITHKFSDTLTAGETTHWYECSVCGAKKDEAAHVYDQTVAHSDYLKAEATATTKAQYYKSCVCGAKSATEYFETDKTAGTLANIQDLSKTYDKVELANPTYETNSDGAVTIEWYHGDTKLDAKPVNAGTYKVKVIIAESATYTGISAEKEFTIAKKVLSNLSVDLTYAGTNSFEVPLGAANGILAGDVADGIKVCITFANKNVGAAVTGAGLDAEDGNNYTNYELDLTTCTASIVPKVLTNISFGNTIYKGSTNFAFVLSAYHGLVSGETFTLQVTTASKNVGNAVEITSISYANNNYSIDKSAITLNIVPKELDVSGLSSSFVYKYNEHQHNIQIPGLIEGENLTYHVNFRSKDVGSDPIYYGFFVNNSALTKEETLLNYKPSGYADWSEWGLEMYNNAEITPVLVEFPELITKEYDQTADFTFAISDISVQNVTVSLKAVDADENALTDADEYVGCNARSVVFYIDGIQTNNYAFVETEGVVNVTITPKQLNFNTLYFNYPPSYYYTTLEIRLGTAVGVYEGDVVRLYANFKNTPANNSAITLDTASSIHLYAENNAKINKNYVLPEDKSTITVYTSTFDFITIDQETLKGSYPVDSDFTDCVLLVNIPTDGGYIFSSTENFMTDSLYDANGNIMKESTNTPGNYGLEAGTYYWQVSVNSTPLGTLNVEKNIPTGAKEKPHQITYNANKFIAEDAHVDWSIADEYYYKVGLSAGTYTVSQKGLKISVFDSSWNTVANLTDKFTISTNGSYYVYISKADNADVYDTITKFTLVNDLSLDGNADFMYDSSYEQGVLVSESYDVTNGQIISFCFDPVYNISSVFSFELISDTKSFGNLVASYRFYDSDFRAVDITWNGSKLTFPSGYTEQDALYIVVQFKAADTGVYLRAE